jgi:phosphatidylglycerophosphatase A
VALLVATAGGLGYSPVAPGTLGSLLALVLLWALPFSRIGLALTILVVVAVGAWAAGRAERLLGRKDPGTVVIDEIAGMFLSMFALPRSLKLLLAAFIVFRLLDILKPFPIRQSQALSGGLGIMLDDLIAGAYTLALLWGLLAVWGRSA